MFKNKKLILLLFFGLFTVNIEPGIFSTANSFLNTKSGKIFTISLTLYGVYKIFTKDQKFNKYGACAAYLKDLLEDHKDDRFITKESDSKRNQENIENEELETKIEKENRLNNEWINQYDGYLNVDGLYPYDMFNPDR